MLTDQPLPVGSRCRFEIRLGGHGPVLEGTAEVAHIREGDPEEPAGMGIHFLTLDREGADLLVRLTALYEDEGGDAMRTALAEALAECERRRLEEESTEDPGPAAEEEGVATDRIVPISVTERAGRSKERGGSRRGVSGEALDDTAPIPPPVSDDEGTPPRGIDATSGEELALNSEAPEPSAQPPAEPAPEAGPGSEPRGADDSGGTSDVPSEGPSLATESRRAGASGWIWAAGLVGFALGGWLLWTNREAFPLPELVASEELAGWEDQDPYEIVEATDVASAVAARAAMETADPGSTEARTEDMGVPEDAERAVTEAGDPTFRSLEVIRWFQEGDGLAVELRLDGEVPGGSYRTFRPATHPPRIVVQLFGVDDPYPPEEIPVDSDLVHAIRLGFHPEGEGGEQRVVLDLANPGVVLQRIEARGETLVVVLGQGGALPESEEPVEVP